MSAVEDDPDKTPILPAHIEETIQAIARLHADHHEQSSPLQKVVDRTTSLIGRPWFVGILSIVIALWIVANALASWAGIGALDVAPFNWLQGAVSLLALYITIMILTTQRREDELAGYREQLTLELAILSEQKSAKIIQLLEEMRRDDPSLRNRVDREAEAMSMAADPQSVLDAIKESHDAISAADRP